MINTIKTIYFNHKLNNLLCRKAKIEVLVQNFNSSLSEHNSLVFLLLELDIEIKLLQRKLKKLGLEVCIET